MKIFDDNCLLISDDICLMTQDSLDIWWHLFEMTSCSGHLFVICLKSYFLYNIWWHLIVYMWWHLTLDDICLMHQDSSDNWWYLFEISLCSGHLLAVCLKSFSLKIFDSICLFTFDDIYIKYLIFLVEFKCERICLGFW